MSDSTPRPDRPSLVQLRKQAKELLRQLRNGDPSATECLRKYKANVSAPIKLRMLMGQGAVATDEGFRSLNRSQTIEYFWGRACPNLKGPGFVALSRMRALKGLAVSCKFVDDAALARLICPWRASQLRPKVDLSAQENKLEVYV